MRALDIKITARMSAQVDRAIQAVSDDIEGQLHRQFYPVIDTKFWDWPNAQSPIPWRLWFDAAEVAEIPTDPDAVQSGGVTVSLADILWGNPRYGPPYRYLELNRSASSFFSVGQTPQRDISIAATYGYWTKTDPAGLLVNGGSLSSSASSFTVSSGAAAGVGDLLLIGSERMLVTDKQMVDTTVAFAGLTSEKMSDDTLAVSDGSAFSIDEVLLFDSERCLVADITGNTLVLKRAWDGSNLSAHSSGTVWAARKLLVTRGEAGTTAATHADSSVISKNRVPSSVHGLAVGAAEHQVLNEIGGYSDSKSAATAQDELDKAWSRTSANYGRNARQRVI